MRKMRLFLIIILMIVFIPIIEVEEIDVGNGTTVIDYRNLVSYGWEYTLNWYLNYKENLQNEQSRGSEIGHTSESSDDRKHQKEGVDELQSN